MKANLEQKIYVAGHQGMVGSAIVRVLKRKGFTNIIGKSHAELDLTNQVAVQNFFKQEKPDQVYLAAAKFGDHQIHNSPIQNNKIHLPRLPKVDQGQKILVTGANGFIGRALCYELLKCGYSVHGIVREGAQLQIDSPIKYVAMGNFDAQTNWTKELTGVNCVVHLAAHVHVMHVRDSNALARFRKVNVEGTINLARQAASVGVSRFIFISSIKVNGESTQIGQSFRPSDVPDPKDPYGVSKYEAEQLLLQLSKETGMEVVIIRPPLVYGPQVKSNFELLMRVLSYNLPLPFAGFTKNRRSLVALSNLVDLIMTCLHHPRAANEIFLVSDGEDLSTAELLRRMGIAKGYSTKLFYVPSALLKICFIAINKLEMYQRLNGSLQVDISKTKQLLDWSPSIRVDDELRRTVNLL